MISIERLIGAKLVHPGANSCTPSPAFLHHPDVHMLKWQQRDNTFGRYAALHVTAHQLHCVALTAEAAAKLTFDHLRELLTPTACMLHNDMLLACARLQRMEQ